MLMGSCWRHSSLLASIAGCLSYTCMCWFASRINCVLWGCRLVCIYGWHLMRVVAVIDRRRVWRCCMAGVTLWFTGWCLAVWMNQMRWCCFMLRFGLLLLGCIGVTIGLFVGIGISFRWYRLRCRCDSRWCRCCCWFTLTFLSEFSICQGIFWTKCLWWLIWWWLRSLVWL